ncbi:hypothetical protein H4Q26_002510 [Puccinia striiformis f. sp. tritici PST-130]|nr:hypothetical protein H4Q26_002510 [Puccinia striiformis f. sp. tritici PST-130]
MAFFQKRGLSAATRLIQHHPTIQPFSRSILSSLPQTNKQNNSNNFVQRWFSCSKLRSSDHQVNRLSIFQQTKSQNNYKQIFIASAGLVGSVVLLDGFLNRDQRVEPLSQAQKELLNSSFQHTGIGLAITSVLARYMFKNGLTMRMMAMNPLAVAGLGLVGSIGTMMCTLNTSPDNTVPKYGFWLTLLCWRDCQNDKFLYLGGPLLAGVSVVALSSLAPLVLPVTAARTLMLTESISLYGGLAVFSGFVLYDTQKILNHGLLVQQGRMKPDPVNESVGLIMDSINIFIRMVQILSMQSNRK